MFLFRFCGRRWDGNLTLASTTSRKTLEIYFQSRAPAQNQKKKRKRGRGRKKGKGKGKGKRESEVPKPKTGFQCHIECVGEKKPVQPCRKYNKRGTLSRPASQSVGRIIRSRSRNRRRRRTRRAGEGGVEETEGAGAETEGDEGRK